MLAFEGGLRGAEDAPVNTLVVRVRLLDADGVLIDGLPGGLSYSDAAGLYFYPLKSAVAGGFSRTLPRPERVAQVELSLQVWTRDGDLGIETAGLSVRTMAEAPPRPTPPPARDRGLSAKRLAVADRALLRDTRRRLNESLSAWRRPLYPQDAAWMDAVAPLLIERTADAALARKLVRRWLKAGRVSDAARFVELTDDPQTRRELGRRELAEEARRHVGRRARRFSLRAPGVLYLLHNSLPFHSGGYAARAHGLLQGFQRAGWETYPIARAGYPSDRADGAEPQAAYEIGGVEYRYLRQDVSVEQADQPGYVEAYAEAVLEAVPHDRVGVVQAASFYYNALAGRIVADRLGVPLVYEMRGLEWFTHGSQEPRWLESEQAATLRDLELRAAHAADLVFAITGALRDWLVENGVPARKIALLPNGCTADRFTPREKDMALAVKLGVSDSFVVGYIGSVVFYEGVELIVEAVRRARELSGQDIRFLLVGDGAGMPAVQRAIAAHGGESFVIATGRVPHDQVEDYYSVVDAMVLARTDLPVCQVISPLKPVEAMAMGKPLITSDVAAIREMIDASGGGLLYPAGDVDAMAARILEMAASAPLRRELSARGRAWAVEARDWDALASNALAEIRARLFKA